MTRVTVNGTNLTYPFPKISTGRVSMMSWCRRRYLLHVLHRSLIPTGHVSEWWKSNQKQPVVLSSYKHLWGNASCVNIVLKYCIDCIGFFGYSKCLSVLQTECSLDRWTTSESPCSTVGSGAGQHTGNGQSQSAGLAHVACLEQFQQYGVICHQSPEMGPCVADDAERQSPEPSNHWVTCQSVTSWLWQQALCSRAPNSCSTESKVYSAGYSSIIHSSLIQFTHDLSSRLHVRQKAVKQHKCVFYCVIGEGE